MACLFAARLAGAQVPIIMLGSWQAGLQGLDKYGVRLVEADGHETAYPVQVTHNPSDCVGVRNALVLVKSWGTERAAHQLSTCLAPDGIALTLQNGLGNQEILVKELGAQRVALGVTTLGATLLEPGRARVAGNGVVSLGEHPRLSTLANMLSNAGITTEITRDTAALQWGKLVISATINPLTALLGVPNGELLERQSARAFMGMIANETAQVASKAGIQLPYPDPLAAVEKVARQTASNISSMLQDIRRGTPTEIDAICGAIVHVGRQVAVETPINATLWHLIKALQTQTTGTITNP